MQGCTQARAWGLHLSPQELANAVIKDPSQPMKKTAEDVGRMVEKAKKAGEALKTALAQVTGA